MMPTKVVWGLVLALLLGCEERDRLTFENDPDDDIGPVSRINPPAQDTTILEGDPFLVGARTVDTSGVDSVFIAVSGANLSYPPIDANGADTLTFALNLPTFGLAGHTITLEIFGVDVVGNVGPTVSRSLTIQ